MKTPHLLAVLATGLSVVACQGSSTSADWSYEGDSGPDHWADLSEDYALARTGQRQSPINISTSAAKVAALPRIDLDYQPHGLAIFNNGHTVEDDYTGGGSMTVDGHTYELAQFHFHSPSEHTLDGQHAAMEMHLVHKDAQGALAVLAVMIVEGEENEAFSDLSAFIPTEPGRADHVEGVTVDVNDLLPARIDSYRYSGSLTTPPCSEGVAWFVLADPIEVSADQIANFREVFFGNNRPTQALNGRVVRRDR